MLVFQYKFIVVAVLFRAKVIGNGTCEEILTAITNWVSSGRATITVNFNTLRASENCVVETDSADAQFPQCSPVATGEPEPAQGDIGLPVGAAAGGILVVLLILTIAIIAAIICFRKKKKSRR